MQPKINYSYFKIHKSLRYHFFRDLQLVNFLSSAKITKFKFIKNLLMIFFGSFLFSTCTKLTSKSMKHLFPYDSFLQTLTEILAFFYCFLLLLLLHYNNFIFRFSSLHCLKTVKFVLHVEHRISWCHFVEIMIFSNEEKWFSWNRIECF